VAEHLQNVVRHYNRSSPLSRRQGMTSRGTTLEGGYTRFLGRNGLREKGTEIDTKISVERISSQLQSFHQQFSI
jgi:hypothetical protein